MKYYAKDDALLTATTKPSGAIEITQQEYQIALQAKLQGRKAEVRDNVLWIANSTMQTLYSTADGEASEIPDNDDIPSGYVTTPRPDQWHEWSGDAWVMDDDAFLAAKKAEYESAVELHLDAVALEHGYNTIYTALSYRGSSTPKWAAEASALSDWRDSVWQHVFAMYVDVEAGTIPIPALQDVIDGLPQYTFVYEADK